MKYWVEFPRTGSQWDGRHSFYSKKQRDDWMAWASKRGADTENATIGEGE